MQDNIIRFNINAFWKEKTCPKHQDDDTPQCCSCSRRCPRGEQWVEELDGRIVCLGCLSTIVRDTQDAQPLYNEVRPLSLMPAMVQQTTQLLLHSPERQRQQDSVACSLCGHSMTMHAQSEMCSK